MDVPLSASVHDDGEEWVSSVPGGTLDVNVDESSLEDETDVGALSEQTYTQELEDLSRKHGQSQEQDKEKIVVEEGTFSGLDRDAVKEEAEMSKTEHQTEKGKIDNENDSTLVRTDEEQRKEKEPELGEGEQQMKDGAEVKLKSEKESMGKDVLVGRESDKQEKETIALHDEEKDLDGGGVQSKVNAKPVEKQMKMEKNLKNLDKGEGAKKEKREKCEKKVNSSSGQPEGDKKKEKKDKKSKSSSERIQNKLEKINAKIGRILVKKEEYELRLKEAQERERQGSEEDALQEIEASTAVMGNPVNEYTGPGVRRVETLVADGFRLDDDVSTKESNYKSPEKGFSGSLSRLSRLTLKGSLSSSR